MKRRTGLSHRENVPWSGVPGREGSTLDGDQTTASVRGTYFDAPSLPEVIGADRNPPARAVRMTFWIRGV